MRSFRTAAIKAERLNMTSKQSDRQTHRQRHMPHYTGRDRTYTSACHPPETTHTDSPPPPPTPVIKLSACPTTNSRGAIFSVPESDNEVKGTFVLQPDNTLSWKAVQHGPTNARTCCSTNHRVIPTPDDGTCSQARLRICACDMCLNILAGKVENST